MKKGHQEEGGQKGEQAQGESATGSKTRRQHWEEDAERSKIGTASGYGCMLRKDFVKENGTAGAASYRHRGKRRSQTLPFQLTLKG